MKARSFGFVHLASRRNERMNAIIVKEPAKFILGKP